MNRLPGLHQEEVAHLAGISVDYDNRLERGRATGISPEVLDALDLPAFVQNSHVEIIAANAHSHSLYADAEGPID